MPIRNLTATDSLSTGDNFAIGSANNGDDRKATGAVLVTFLESALDFSPSGAFPNYLTQYAAPSATGFNVQITDADDNIHLILTPVAAYAAGTITLPTSTNLADKQEVLVNSTQAVTALTIDGNGATVTGGPSNLVANSFFRLRYDLAGNTWYLVGSGDATTISGYVVATTATADTIVLRDSNADIFGRVLSSGVATGTAPLIVASTTKVANLNADLLDDLNTATASTISTIAARDASGNLTANVLVSDVAIGTAPLTVTSTTKVANLNADLLDDMNTATASTATTIAARDGSGDLTANVLISDVATGTAPLTVSSTTQVANLNAETVNGIDETQFLRSDTADDAAGKITFTVGPAVNNNIAISFKESGGTERDVILVDGSDILQAGSANLQLNINTSGNIYIVTSDMIFDNNQFIRAKEAGGTERAMLAMDASDIIRLGNGSNQLDFFSNGTARYNSTTLASGTFTTTDGKTVTVVDGFITSIV